MLYFHEPTSFGMIVIDGDKQVIAKAKKVTSGWILSAVNGCWLDPRARTSISPKVPIYPQYLFVKTKKEARSILKSLLDVGVVK